MITYKIGGTNLFTEHTESIVNPVNCQGISGAGIAYWVSVKYPEETKVYKSMCRNRQIAPGVVGVIKASGTEENPYLKYIFALPTINTFEEFNKLNYAEKLHLVEIGLKSLREKLLNMPELKSVTLPALGCGVAGLQWGDVKTLIEQILSGLHQEIVVIEPREKVAPDHEDEEYEDEDEEF